MYVDFSYQNMSLILQSDLKLNLGELWLGDLNSAQNIQILKAKSIKTVISIVNKREISFKQEDDITHHYFNAPDTPTYKIYAIFPETNELISQGLKKGGVLVHCVAGISRSSTLTIAYLMVSKSWSFEKSLHFVRQRRNINPNTGFTLQLMKYSKDLQAKLMITSPIKDFYMGGPQTSKWAQTPKSEESNDKSPKKAQKLNLTIRKNAQPVIDPETPKPIQQTNKPLNQETSLVLQQHNEQQSQDQESLEKTKVKGGRKIPSLKLAAVTEFEIEDSPTNTTRMNKQKQELLLQISPGGTFHSQKKLNVLSRCVSDHNIQSWPFLKESTPRVAMTEKSRQEFSQRYENHKIKCSTSESQNEKNSMQIFSYNGLNKEYLMKRIDQIKIDDLSERKSERSHNEPKKTNIQLVKKPASALYKTEYNF